MRILCLNAWGGRLHAPLLSFLAEADPDVLCLQEVTRGRDGSPGWLTYRDGDHELRQRADLLGDLRKALPRHDAYFCPAARGLLYDGERPVPSEHGLATFVRNTLSVIGQAQDFVHGTFSARGWGDHPRARNAHCVRVFSGELGGTVTVAHMHGLRDPAGKGDTPARASQAQSFAGLIRRVWSPGERLVACGDFNVLPDSQTFDTLGTLGLVDLVTGRGHADTRTSHYRKAERFADYMLVTRQVEVLRFDVPAEPEVSDHRPLVAEIA
ncbi:MAG TPA: endonuclease/exonuclease/phosphatase family protein [Mesorhizobium sp.]|nr:endonuclease/exonuclease/phosphatase family protein [Mesorhizobium sp.]